MVVRRSSDLIIFSDDTCLLLQQHECIEEKKHTRASFIPMFWPLREISEWIGFLHTPAGCASICWIRVFHEIRENYKKTIAQAQRRTERLQLVCCHQEKMLNKYLPFFFQRSVLPQAHILDQHPHLIFAIFSNKWNADGLYCSGFSLRTV